MKHFFILILLLPILGIGQESIKKPEAEVIKINEQLFTEYALNHNTKPFEETAKDDFVLIAAPGMVETKEQAIAGVKNLDIKTVKVTVDKVIVNNNVGIVIGVLMMEGTIMGRPVPKNIRYSSTFIKEDAQWKLQIRTMTPMMMRGSKK